MTDKKLADKIITSVTISIIILIISLSLIALKTWKDGTMEIIPEIGYNLVIYDKYNEGRIVYKYNDINVISTEDHYIEFTCVNSKGQRVTKSLYTSNYELESYEKKGENKNEK